MPETLNSSNNFQWFWEKLDLYLRTRVLKQTKQRRIIVSRFLQLNSHVDAETLYESLKLDHPNIGLATIYRTLNLLKAANLVEEQSFADGRALFEILDPDSHHDHLICLECSKVIEFQNETIEKLQNVIAQDNGFQLISHRLDLYGYCRACQN